MKKIVSILLALLMASSMTACSNNNSTNESTEPPETEFVAWQESNQEKYMEYFGKTFNMEGIENVEYFFNIEVNMAEAKYYVEKNKNEDGTPSAHPQYYQVVARMMKMDKWLNILSDTGEQFEEATDNTLAEGIDGKITSGEDPFGKYVAGVWFDEELQIVYALMIYNEDGDLSIAKDIFTSKAD